MKLATTCGIGLLSWCAMALAARPAEASLMHSALDSMTATDSSGQNAIGFPPIPDDPAAQIVSMNGVDVSELQLGTTTFSGAPVLGNQIPEYADEFGLSANASADGQDFMQTVFSQPTAQFFVIEKGGNDSGTMVGLDVNGNEVDTPVDFSEADFNSGLGYTVFEGQDAAGMVITSDVLLHGIRFYAPGIDPVSISSRPFEIVNSAETFTWGERAPVGSWSNTSGWRKNGADTSEIPQVVQNLPEDGLADPVRVLSGTVQVDTADQAAYSLQVDSGANLEIASGLTLELLDTTNISSGGTMVVGGSLDTPTITSEGTVMFTGGSLATESGSIANVTTDGDALFENRGDLALQQVTLNSGDTLVKQSTGTLLMNQSGGSNSLPNTSSISLEGGVLAAVNGVGSNVLGEATVNVAGGDLVLSSQQAGAAAFDTPIAVNTANSIIAAQAAGALAGQTIQLGGTSGMQIASGGQATLETADNYTIQLAGEVSGAGRLVFGDGASVDVNSSVSPATVEFRGDTSQLTGASTVSPGQARVFAPTEATSNMEVGFDVGGPADVVVEGLVDGSVALNGDTSYTGATRIRRGALHVEEDLPEASRLLFEGGGNAPAPLQGDYNDDQVVDDQDYDEWTAAYGDNVMPGSGADGNGDGVVGAADFVVWRNDLGNTGGGGPEPIRLAVVESAGESFTGSIGTGDGELQWIGGGGFASRGNTTTGELVVSLEGGAQLNWDSPDQGFNGQVLQFGSAGADGRVDFQNDIALGSAEERTVQVADNPDTTSDMVRISGVISSAGTSDDLLTINDIGEGSFSGGLIELAGNNTFANALRIEDATVLAEQGVGLPTDSRLEFSANNDNRPAIFATSGTFSRDIGSGTGEVLWVDQETPNPNAGGFAAIGGDLTVTLEGGADLTWSDPDAGFNGQDLQMGSPYGDDVVTLTNRLDNDGADRGLETFDNPTTESDRVVLAGDVVSSTGNSLYVDGAAHVEFNGNLNFTDSMEELTGDLFPQDSTTVVLNGTENVVDDITINHSSNVFINGHVEVRDDLVFGDGANEPESDAGFGGTGTIVTSNFDTTRVAIEDHTHLRPGAGRNQVGTLDLEISGGGAFEMEAGGTYEFDVQENGGSLENDSMMLTGSGGVVGEFAVEPGGSDDWTIEINALNDVSGLVGTGDELDLFEWNDLIDLIVDGTNITLDVGPGTAPLSNVSLVSSDFDVSSASAHYQVNSDFSGRLFVTGLEPLAGAVGNASVPEPGSGTLLLVASAACLSTVAGRRRQRAARCSRTGER